MSSTTAQQTKWWNGGRSPFNVEYGKLMMWYFLMSDAFTFGAFLISYGTIRFSQNFWPDPNVNDAYLGTWQQTLDVFNQVPNYRPVNLTFTELSKGIPLL